MKVPTPPFVIALASVLSLAGGAEADEVVVQGGPLTRHMILLVDASASMSADGEGEPLYPRAIERALWVMTRVDDDTRVAVGVFASSNIEWLMIPPNPDDPDDKGTDADGWACLPSVWVMRHVHGGLMSREPGGATPMGIAVDAALALCRTVPDGCIVVVTDGEPDGGNGGWADIRDRVKSQNVALSVIRVGGSQQCESALKEAVVRAGGSYMRSGK